MIEQAVTNPGWNADWNLVRTFACVASQGSFAAAARTLDLAYPTVARHIQQLEAKLGLALFDRRTSGVVLNQAGAALETAAHSMLAGADAFQSACRAFKSSCSGTVRITASEFLADVFPELLVPLRRARCDGLINIDLLIANQSLNLLEGQADLAIKHVEPNQQDLVCRRLAGLPFGLYASTGYLSERGIPELSNMGEHWYIDAVSVPRFARGAQRMGYPIAKEQFVFRSDSITGQLNGAQAGWGIAGLPIHIANRHVDLQRVLLDAGVEEIDMWLVGRPEVHTTAYLKKTFTTVAEMLNSFVLDVLGADAIAMGK
ncbi:MAG: LysR family transcriptional regulator [Gammaproteobacteria bacterium]|nr:LysR family transcriptional regulator [Gammaproteobacteria bacterium]